MRLRDAKRLCKFLYLRKLEPVDYWAHLSTLHPVIGYRDGCFTFRYKNLQRKHCCAFRLFKLVYPLLHGHCFFQRQCLVYNNMSNPLSEAVEAEVARLEVPTIVVDGFRSFKPQPLPVMPPAHPHVIDVVSHVQECKPSPGYVHSSNIRDVGRMAKGFTKLVEKPFAPYDPQVAWELFVDVALTLPVNDKGGVIVEDVPEFTAVEMAAQPQTSSGAGLLPLNPLCGSVVGSKHTMHTAAVNVNLEDKLSGSVAGMLPYQPSLKDEVLKDGKDPRVILLESQANYMVLKHYFGNIMEGVDPCSGIAIGLSGRGGDFKVIPFTWWEHLDCDYDGLIGWLKNLQCHESDKTSWEASTNVTDGLVYILSLLMRINVCEPDIPILARALADYINPAIIYGGRRCFFAPWRVPSGSYLTSHGNSVRHRLMARYVVNYFAKHGSAGSMTCSCPICLRFRDESLPDWGKRLTGEELSLLDSCFVQGDDFIGVAVAPYVFDAVLDFVFNTTTKTVVRPFFGTPDEPGVEFLRRHFLLEGDRIRIFRSAPRMLGKIYNGSHRTSRERFCAALDCAMRECGHNEALFRTLYHMRHDVAYGAEELDQRRYRDALDKYARRVPDIADYQFGYVPTFSVLCNADASDLRALKMVKDFRATNRWGVSPREYMA